MKPLFTAILPSFSVAVLMACDDPTSSLASGLSPGVAANAFANSEWSAPMHLGAPINSPSRELGAELSPDELSLYFASDRPGSIDGTMDIWASRRECLACPWATPVNLKINSPRSDGGPAFSPDGHFLFFSSDRDLGLGGDDIWVAYRENTDDDLGWGAPMNLGTGVNTPLHETGPVYVPALLAEGVNLYFVRGATLAAFDLYRARLGREGDTPEPATAVTELNSAALDGDPTITHDGREIFFWSQRPGSLVFDIWWATRANPHTQWSVPQKVGIPISTPGPDLTPSISGDGRTLLWSAGFAARGGLGLTDIWMATRHESHVVRSGN